MDVGSTVGNLAIFTALFAAMSCLALSVELGDGPKIKSRTSKFSWLSFLPFLGKSLKKKETENKGSGGDIGDLEKTVVTNEALTDGVAASELDESNASITSLRGRFIDGFLGPRIKYDVALTVLYESQNKKVEKPDEGLDVATQAFLEATQSMVFSEE